MKDYENYKHSEVTDKIIKVARKVFRELGSGFIEKVYENAMAIELEEAEIPFETQKPIVVYYKGKVAGDFTTDMIVEDKVIVELKAVKTINEVHQVQLVNYLKATEYEVGLLINFGEKLEIKRKVFSVNHKKTASSASKTSVFPSFPASSASKNRRKI